MVKKTCVKNMLMIMLAGVMVVSSVTTAVAESSSSQPDDNSFESILTTGLVSYEEYLQAHSGAVRPNQKIIAKGGSFTEGSQGFEKVDYYDGGEVDAVLTLAEGSVSWQIEASEAGLYNMNVLYYPVTGSGSTIERELYINGEIPFSEARYLAFSRNWKDETGIVEDSRGNDVRPKQIEAPVWMDVFIKDPNGYYSDAFLIYLDKGVNTVTLSSTMGQMLVGQITFTQKPQAISYDEYRNAHARMPYAADPIKVQGEDASYKSDSILYPIMDRTSPMTEPYKVSKISLNTIGGSNWRVNGQTITWILEIPESGLYEIDIKYRQNLKSGTTVTRALKINGEIPFKEAGEIPFFYKNDWQVNRLGEDDDPYLFYFEEGSHTLSLEVVLGAEMSAILRQIRESISELNRVYRQLLIVIGSSPDTIRDYQLEQKTPEALKTLEEQYFAVKHIYENLTNHSQGTKGSQLAVIDNLMYQLELMYSDPQTVPKLWGAFKDSIVALGSFELSMREQPLEIDYFILQPKGAEKPVVRANFIQQLIHEIRAFIASFYEDYDTVGEVYGGQAAVDVWILASGAAVTGASGSGRDQATIIKNLVDNFFVPENQIPVNIRLVNSEVLLSATLAGRGPDAALNVGGREPVNYALRNAVTDVSQFGDFDEVREWFHPEAFVQFSLQDGVYALPQTMSFNVMFYRADVLAELGLDVPRKWDDFYRCLTVIEKNNMNVGIAPDWVTYGMYLYQHGGEYYSNDLKSSALDTEAAVRAFRQWTGNYVNYDMPVAFDFANRFRTGEMPLAISDYTNFNFLSVLRRK